MSHTLPATPIAALDISSFILKLKIAFAVKSAELLGHWRTPFKMAATTFDEMTIQDIYYWIYKCKNPVMRTEDGRLPSEVFKTDLRQVRLPEGFQKSSAVTLGAAGDILQAVGLEHSKGVLYERIADLLFDQSIAFANFESPLSETPFVKEVISDRAPPIECCSREQFETLKRHNGKCFDVFNITNNHTADKGLAGVTSTQACLAENGILDVGTSHSPDDYGKGRVLVKDGVKIGFASATFGLNGHTLPPGETYRINVSRLLSKFVPPELGLLKEQIDHCRQEGCDFIIASLHWGFEFEFFPRNRQMEAARELVEHGADTVICHHPHVIQPVEYYQTKRDPDRIAVIAYSLGSLVWGYTAPHLALSAILNLTIAKGTYGGQSATYIENARVTPTFRSSTWEDGKIVTRIEKLADHVDGRSKVHPASYVRKVKQYADLVLGPYDR